MSTLRLLGRPFLIAVVLALLARSAVRIYSIPTPSMEPTLQVGDHIVVTPYYRALPQQGDVVVFRSPANPDVLFVKRIVATPGDLVSSRAGRLTIDGHAVAEPYLLSQATTGDIPPQIVAGGSYFVLGDNRANSFDSREWGVLPRDRIIGRARLILWSSGSGAMKPQASASPASPQKTGPAAAGFRRLFEPIR